MLSITLQVNLHTAVHAHQHCVGDAFWSHNQNKGHVFEEDENKATIVAQSKQNNIVCIYNPYTTLFSDTIYVTVCRNPIISWCEIRKLS